MKILNWNVRGLGDSDKSSLVRQTVVSCHPDILSFQETKLSSISSLKGREFLPARLRSFSFMPADGSAGGILLAWDQSIMDCTMVSMHKFHITAKFSSTSNNMSFMMFAIYAPCEATDRAEFFLVVNQDAASVEGPWILLGDFNMCRFDYEKSKGRINWQVMEVFNDWIRTNGLDDIDLVNRRFTWSNKREHPTLERLDRVLANNNSNLSFLQTTAIVVPAVSSDHSPILVQFDRQARKCSLLRFEDHWLDMDETINIVTDGWNKGTRPISASSSLIYFKLRRIRSAI